MEITIIKLKKVVDSLIKWVRQDLIDNALTYSESWLYTEFNDVVLDDTNFYTQLKSLIEKGDEDKRKLEVRLMFDVERANLPTIHIHYPQEDGRSGDNTLNTGFTVIESGDSNVTKYSRSFIGQYDLIITGGNSLEVIMLYEFLDALLIAAADTLSYNFDKFEFSGKQLMANQEIIPHLTYYRAIGLSLQNKKQVRAIVNKGIPTDIKFTPNYYLDNQEPNEELVNLKIIPSSTQITVGGSITIHTVVENAGENPVFKWTINDTLIDDISSILILDFNTTGEYTIVGEVTSSILHMDPRSSISNTITITVVE